MEDMAATRLHTPSMMLCTILYTCADLYSVRYFCNCTKDIALEPLVIHIREVLMLVSHIDRQG